MSSIKSLALLALATGFASVASAAETGKTTRYWDCCKGSCSWPGKADVSAPVTTCDKNDSPLTDANTASACDGGSAYMCSDQSPWAVSDDLAYGFAAVNIAGGSEDSWCCSCYKLTFTTTSIAGKSMIVQATNTGGDLGSNQFDLAIPGGGVGIFNACTDEYNAPSSGWGAQYGGISSNTCSTFPKALQSGCNFRFGDWFEGADNPEVEFERVACPAAITAKSGCKRTDDGAQSAVAAPASSAVASSSVAQAKVAVASSSAVVSSSSETAPSAYSTSEAAPVASSSSEAAPVASSTSSEEAVAAETSSVAAVSSAYTAPAVESSAAASSAYSAPAAYSSAASSAYVASSSSVAAASSVAAPSSTASSDDANCNVQYVYEYDL
ncbi:hypothetical protein D6D04_04472 [Aureobasidium pullulans]|nr:hypothetical protein D6D04_04472 [Aureobasidium pullulans]